MVLSDPALICYARCSTGGQSVNAQAKQLRAAEAERVFQKAANGALRDGDDISAAAGSLTERAIRSIMLFSAEGERLPRKRLESVDAELL
jgi:hypothetical protein